jgi:hypothetical protein
MWLDAAAIGLHRRLNQRGLVLWPDAAAISLGVDLCVKNTWDSHSV